MYNVNVLSYDGSYREFCYSASRHNEVFQNFKNHPICRWAIEYAKPEQGKEYLKKILHTDGFEISVEQWKDFLKNDSVGKPLTITYNFSKDGSQMICSPTTLRYIKVLSDVVTFFDIDKIKTVAEIGVGYGGQCRILKSFFKIDTYNLIDLPETLALAERFLETLDPSDKRKEEVRFIDGTHLYRDVDSDFFISSYAFSELQRFVQDMYIEKVISKAKAGYISWEGEFSKSTYGVDGYTLDEFLEKIPYPKKVIPEKPVSTSTGNRIIMWGSSKFFKRR